MKNLKKLSREELKSISGGNAPEETQECGDTCGGDLVCSPSCSGGCKGGTCGPLMK